MGLSEWVRRLKRRFETQGARETAIESGYELYSGSWRLGRLLPIQETNIYDREWDALIILDGCRVDLLREVANEYEFIGSVDTITSVGSMSSEWMTHTFDASRYADGMEQTAYVTANVFSEQALNKDRFRHIDEVWRYGWDKNLNTIPPRPVTDRAITVGRERQPHRLIVHYMQPHHPFIADTDMKGRFGVDPFGRDNTGEDFHQTVWDALRRGRISLETVWEAYRANLRLVLDEFELLRANLDADRMIITADHGNAIGEWGIYDHPIGFPHPSVKQVPWVETSAQDTGKYVPESTEAKPSQQSDVEEHLRALGYR